MSYGRWLALCAIDSMIHNNLGACVAQRMLHIPTSTAFQHKAINPHPLALLLCRLQITHSATRRHKATNPHALTLLYCAASWQAARSNQCKTAAQSQTPSQSQWAQLGSNATSWLVASNADEEVGAGMGPIAHLSEVETLNA